MIAIAIALGLLVAGVVTALDRRRTLACLAEP
jgi:hypothetical protein